MGYVFAFLAGGYFSVLAVIALVWYVDKVGPPQPLDYLKLLFWPIGLAVDLWPKKTRYLP